MKTKQEKIDRMRQHIKDLYEQLKNPKKHIQCYCVSEFISHTQYQIAEYEYNIDVYENGEKYCVACKSRLYQSDHYNANQECWRCDRRYPSKRKEKENE